MDENVKENYERLSKVYGVDMYELVFGEGGSSQPFIQTDCLMGR